MAKRPADQGTVFLAIRIIRGGQMKNSKRNRVKKKKKVNKAKGMSKYARKKSFLHKEGGFGFEHEEKSWK